MMLPRFSSLLAPAVAACLTAAAIPSLHAATAKGGDLDTSFGTGGKVISVFPSNYTPPMTAPITPEKVLIYPDGKILVVGTVNVLAGIRPALARYLPDGSLDTSFGTGGFVTVNIAAYSSGDPKEVYSALLLPDGKILLGGRVFYKFAVMRLNMDGTQDMTFGNQSGVAEYSGNNLFTDRGCEALALLGDGSILAAGSVTFPPPASSSGKDFVVVHFSANGVLDTSFGSSGRAAADFGVRNDILGGMAVSSTGRIVTMGYSNTFAGGDTQLAMACFTSTGVLDTTFSGDGKDLQGTGTPAYGTFPESLAVLADGKILVAGSSAPNPVVTSSDFTLVKYNANGTLDTSFGTAGTGLAYADFGALSTTDGRTEESVQCLLVQPDGKLVSIGHTGEVSQNGSNANFAMARHHSNGTLDSSFGLNGVAVAQMDVYKDYAYAGALQPDGKIVMAGIARNSSDRDRIGVARVWGHTPVQTWRLKHFGSIAATGNAVDSADPDGDGRSNLLEYALGTSPVSGLQGTSTLALSVERVGIRDYATATITKPHGEEGLSYNMTVAGGNMSQWFTDGLYTTVLVDDVTTFKIRDNTYLTGQVPRFAKIIVNWLVP